jgi:hypothetical protein
MDIDIEKIRSTQKDNLSMMISEIKNYLIQYDFKVVLITLFLKENFDIFTQGGQLSDDPYLATYVADLYLSSFEQSKNEIPSHEIVDQIIDKLKEIYLTYMFLLKLNDTKNELATDVMTDSLLVKRSFFIKVFSRVNEQILSEGSKYFDRKYGFRIACVFGFREAFMHNIISTLNDKSKSIDLYEILDINVQRISELMGVTNNELMSFLQFFSVSNSYNEKFLPRNDNPLILKPIIKARNNYFCINTLSLIENVRKNMEIEIRKDDKEWQKYCKNRGKILEDIVFTELSSFFKGCKIYRNLKYQLNNDDSIYETDLIIEVDQYLVIIESKSGSLSNRAVSGFNDRLNKDITELIHNAHNQCRRTLKYLDSIPVATFSTQDGDIKIRKQSYEKIYLLSITLDNLELITANIHKILNVSGNINVVTLSIYDFSVILEILRGPAEFLLYLDRRGKTIIEGKINAHDELDIFSAFIYMGLSFQFDEKYDTIDVTNFSDDIEKYYLIGPAKEPIPRMKNEYRIQRIVDTLKTENKPGNVAIAKELIAFDYLSQKIIARKIERLIKHIHKKGKSDFSIVSKESNAGITIYGNTKFQEDYDLRILSSFIQSKMKDTKCPKWYLIVIKDNKKLADFNLYRFGEYSNISHE